MFFADSAFWYLDKDEDEREGKEGKKEGKYMNKTICKFSALHVWNAN